VGVSGAASLKSFTPKNRFQHAFDLHRLETPPEFSGNTTLQDRPTFQVADYVNVCFCLGWNADEPNCKASDAAINLALLSPI
jgi:hypothetical protein